MASKFNKKLFPERSAEEESRILVQFCQGNGPDEENVKMFERAFMKLRMNGEQLVEDVHWAYYPSVPSDPTSCVTPHVTGSAHTEGYYKIHPSQKRAYLENDVPPSTKESLSSKRSKRVCHRQMQRTSQSQASANINPSAIYNPLKLRQKQLKFPKSKIHAWGLFAMEDIAANEMVIEYVGEVIRSSVADEREKRYKRDGIESSYLFRINDDLVIDATKKGNVARFINHSCDPNCYAKVVEQKRIVIYSKQDIKATEEITYDYKFPIEEEKIPCLCGAPDCRGTLN